MRAQLEFYYMDSVQLHHFIALLIFLLKLPIETS